MPKKFFEDEREKPVFRYAIITDTHIMPEGRYESSPWKVNRFANDRARWVTDQINRADVDLVIHMGDIIHPLPYLPAYGPAAEAALNVFRDVKVPIYFIPGNHDVGDKNNPTMPAYVVDDYGFEMYNKWFGRLHRSFDHKSIHFIMINAQVLNSGLAHEAEHTLWLEEDLKVNMGSRVHLFSHYPPYVFEPDEPSNYDNIDEPARSWLLVLLEKYEIEALFAGHVHQFFYQKHGKTDCYNLLSTSFVRQDYSEMFRIEAAAEFGRNDVGKLGWCIVDVYENTHIAKVCRSNGHGRRIDEPICEEPSKIKTYHTKESVVAPIGVHLRHPWAEVVELPYNGPLDEFIRKRVRNDYTLLGLWECGIRRLRVPLNDLVDERTRERMKVLAELGHEFYVFNQGIPQGVDIDIIMHHRDLVNAFEIILPWKDFEEEVSEIVEFEKKVSAPLFLAKIERSSEQKHEDSKFRHYVSYGFRTNQLENLETFMSLEMVKDAINGFVFEIGAKESPWVAIQTISSFIKKYGFTAIVNVRLASENPAEHMKDDIHVSNRVAEAMVVAAAFANVEVFLDTFMDLDRGYFPRVGLYDRRFNRRHGSFTFSHMQGMLNDFGLDIKLLDCVKNPNGKTCVFETDRSTINLFLPNSGKAHNRRIAFLGNIDHGKKGMGKYVNLVSGTVSVVRWNKNDEGLAILNPSSCNVPSLLIVGD